MIDLKALMLRPPRLTLAVAESLTTGRLQARVGATSGASNYFLGGITAYSLEQKVRHLGVDRAEGESVNCVSEAIAAQMARGVCSLFGADIGVATTGYAEPSPDWGVTSPFAWWAVARRRADGTGTLISGRTDCPGATRLEVQDRIADSALVALVGFVAALRASEG